MSSCSSQARAGEVCISRGIRESRIEVGLFTGGFDKPYALGLAMALVGAGVSLEVIGSDDVETPEMHSTPGLCFFNLQGRSRDDISVYGKAWNILLYYFKLIRYAALAKPPIFHILWNNKLQLIDRTLLMMYYKSVGKKVVFTAHNVNAGRRDSRDTWLNRLTLRMQYRLCDHIFVHTTKMKQELGEYCVRQDKVTVVPFGINSSVPNTDLTSPQAKQRLGLSDLEKTILFFGNIGPYKGLDILVSAFHAIAEKNKSYRLIIAGKLRGGGKPYWESIKRSIDGHPSHTRVMQKIEYIPDEETELYFKAADVLALPYNEVSQSGVLFLGYNFGLPVVASDVGSFRDDVIERKTGFLCRPGDYLDLAKTIERYFHSDIFKNLERRRVEIRNHAEARNSWSVVGEATRKVYVQLLDGSQSRSEGFCP